MTGRSAETEGMPTRTEFPNHVEAGKTVLEEPAPAFSTAQAEEIARRDG